MKRESRVPLILAIVLLLLPMCYVGSYLALVEPYLMVFPYPNGGGDVMNYRAFPRACDRFFWPLEQMDRKVRPGTWNLETVVQERNRRAYRNEQ